MSTHEDYTRSHEIRGSSDRTFGLILGGAFLWVGLWPLHAHRPMRWWACAVGAAFWLAAAIAPAGLRPLNRAWMRFGLLLGRVTNPVITALMFYVVFTPAGILLRLFGKDILKLKMDPGAKSYWVDRKAEGSRVTSMADQF